MKYQFILKNSKLYSIERMCHILSVKPAAYYAWRRRGVSRRELDDQKIVRMIGEVYSDKRKRSYGSPRLAPELSDNGMACGKNKVARIMKQNNICAEIKRKHKYKKQHNKENYVASNSLNRNFNPKEINKAWVTDITYLWTRDGWSYLCVFLDLCSRKVVGWSMSCSPNTELVLSALENALYKRNPPEGLLVHSDQGCQYTSSAYRKCLLNNNCFQSMSRRGNCWDNACAESFFSHLKAELIYTHSLWDYDELKLEVFQYIEGFYNRERRHSSCNYLSPFNYEQKISA